MRHFASRRFWQSFEALPAEIRKLAVRNYALPKRDPAHPSLQFKAIHGGRFRSVRIGLQYRALGVPVAEGIQWFCAKSVPGPFSDASISHGFTSV